MMFHRVAETSDERATNASAVIFRLVGYLRPYWRAVGGAFFFILLNAASQGAGPFLIGLAIDRYISAGDLRGLLYSVGGLTGVYLVGWISMRYQIYFMSWAGQRVLADLRTEIITQVNRLSVGYLERKEAGDLMSRLVNDIDAINSFISQNLAQSIGALFALLGIAVAMAALDWRLALASLSIVPVMLLATNRISRMARSAFRKTRTTIGDVSAGLQEELGGVKVTQAFNRSEMNIKRFAERNAANRDANVSANAITSAFAPAMDILATLDMAIVAGYGGFLAVNGMVSVGVVVAFLQYVQNFFRPIQTVATIWTIAQSAFAAAERVFELLDTPPDIQDTPDAISLDHFSGEVRFENVTFGYDEEEPVLVDVDLVAEPGQTIALVGPTGAGKSTLVSLLSRFYEVDRGKIFFDGIDLKMIGQRSLRSKMGIVTQDPFLFAGTIVDNIRYGRLNASDEEVFAAARAAHAHDFIMRLPDGYQTRVGERGGTLSQGQRQLLSIARAILANPHLLILDEATASVDTRTEVLIQKALEQLLTERTSFVIAHRLSTIRNANQVLVIDRGRIVERGTHAELIRLKGLYADLYTRQFYTPASSPAPEPVV